MSNELIFKAFESFVNNDQTKAREYLHEFAVRRGKAILTEVWEEDEKLPEFGGDYDDNVKSDIVDAKDEVETEMNGLSEEEDFGETADEEGLADRVMDLEQGNSEVAENIAELNQTIQDFQAEFQEVLNDLSGNAGETEEGADEFEDIENVEDEGADEFNDVEDDDELNKVAESIEFTPVTVPVVKSPKAMSPIPSGECSDKFCKDAKIGAAPSKQTPERKVPVKVDDMKNTKKSSKEFMKKVSKK